MMTIIHLGERGRPKFRGTSALALKRNKRVEKQRRRENVDTPQRWFSDSRSCCFAKSFSVNQLNVLGAVSDWCVKKLFSRFQIIHSSSTESYLLRRWRIDESRISPNVVTILTNPPSINVFQYRETCCGVTTKDSKLFQKTFEWAEQLAKMVVLCRKISRGKYFMTIHDTCNWQVSDVLDHCREYTSPRDDERSTPKGWIRGKYKNWPSIGCRRLRISSVWTLWKWNQNWFHAERWISILDCDQQRDEQITLMSFQKRTGNPFTTKKWPPVRGDPVRQNRRNNSLHHCLRSQRLLCRSISGSGKTFVPLTYVDGGSLSFNVSKTMTRILRHRDFHREIDGAMEWNRLLPICDGVIKWKPQDGANQMWIGHLVYKEAT